MAKIPDKWQRLFANHLPGYDPIATAGDGQWFDAEAADDAIAFFETHLVFIEGGKAGEPFKLEDWQQAFIGCLFGWKNADGWRRYRESMLYIPRKNGKSPMVAAIIALVLYTDYEPGAQLFSAAASKEQATINYRHCAEMIQRNPDLWSLVKLYKALKSIEYRNGVNLGHYKALASDADTQHGLNAHLNIIEELHAHPKRDLVDVLTTATASRDQPLTIYVTTADYDRESICNEVYSRACAVRDGVYEDPTFLPCIYEATIDDDWKSPETWAKANPNLDVSVKREYLQKECKRAQDTPTFENTFKRLHLNIRTEQDVRWLTLADWDACPSEAIDPESLRGRECFGGLDLSSTTDLTAFVLLFPEPESRMYTLLPFFWIPGDKAKKREDRDRVPYLTWERQGFIERTPGNVVDYDRVRARIKALGEIYNIREIAVDGWNATQITSQLMGDGFEMVKFGQGYASMTAPTKEIEALVMSQRLNHGGNPILRWMASNVAVEMDAAGNIKPAKNKSTQRIDGIVSSIMALGRAMVAEPKKTSVYAKRGLLSI